MSEKADLGDEASIASISSLISSNDETLAILFSPVKSGSLTINSVGFFGRTFDEYLSMFGIDISYLRGKQILDISSGPASFISTGTNLHGLSIIGADPRYSMAATQLRYIAQQTLEVFLQYMKQLPPDPSTPDFNLEQFKATRYDQIESFVADYENDRELLSQLGESYYRSKYIAASLPTLPFPCQVFDLILCSFFLFCYSPKSEGGILDRNAVASEAMECISADISETKWQTNFNYDLNFHLRAIDEMARVCRGELKITPIRVMDKPKRDHPYLAPIREHLQQLGFSTEIVHTEDVNFTGFPSDVLVAKRL